MPLWLPIAPKILKSPVYKQNLAFHGSKLLPQLVRSTNITSKLHRFNNRSKILWNKCQDPTVWYATSYVLIMFGYFYNYLLFHKSFINKRKKNCDGLNNIWLLCTCPMDTQIYKICTYTLGTRILALRCVTTIYSVSRCIVSHLVQRGPWEWFSSSSKFIQKNRGKKYETKQQTGMPLIPLNLTLYTCTYTVHT